MQEEQIDTLQKAIAELKNAPTVNIKGKNYTQVSTRINIFRKYFLTGTIQTLITHSDDTRVIVQTKISVDGNIVATGYAEEIRGDGNYINSTSAVENCETSSIGRALSNFGLGGSEYASSFEVENAISQQSTNNMNNSQQQSNYTPTKQYNQMSNNAQPNYNNLINLGLQIIDNNNGSLIVVGDSVFENKEIIKQNGFRWDGTNKQWYKQLNEQQAA